MKDSMNNSLIQLMQPRFEILPETKLIGKRLRMSIANNRTGELWRSFMPVHKAIKDVVSTDLYCVQVFDPSHDFNQFNPNTEFDKWAACQVATFHDIPPDMEMYTITGGEYAVFLYQGAASAFQKTFEYIFFTWFPQSDYEVDKREHFEILGDKYKNEDPSSEEEIWIPIKRK
jgi:AraC family transcriptional regulator